MGEELFRWVFEHMVSYVADEPRERVQRTLHSIWKLVWQHPPDDILIQFMKSVISSRRSDELRPLADYCMEKYADPILQTRVIFLTVVLMKISTWVVVTMDRVKGHQIIPVVSAVNKVHKGLRVFEFGALESSK